MMRYIYIGGEPVATYFIAGVSGYLVSMLIVLAKRRAFDLRIRDVFHIAICAAIGILGGAKILSVIVNLIEHDIASGFWTIQYWRDLVLRSGWVFYGGFLGGIGMLALLAKLKRRNMKNLCDSYVYVALGFLSFARIGCYCTGCCYGIELAGAGRFPVQLVEAGYCAFILLAFLLIRPERRYPDTSLLLVFLIVYPVGRFILEFLRGDESRGVFLLSTSQWISLALLATAVLWMHKIGKFPLKSGNFFNKEVAAK